MQAAPDMTFTAHHTKIRIQKQTFSHDSLVDELMESSSASIGAVVTFTGLVRDDPSCGLEGLFLEHYPGMTEKALENIVAKARARWPSLVQVSITHRVGEMGLMEPIVFVGVTSPHRQEAFDAASFLMDFLKNDAPFWKKELGQTERWVEQKESDRTSKERWLTNS
jgi:molybdopterin synthase catalytic subunit